MFKEVLRQAEQLSERLDVLGLYVLFSVIKHRSRVGSVIGQIVENLESRCRQTPS